MTQRAAFEQLGAAQGSLSDRLTALAITVTEDRPIGSDHILIDQLSDRIEEIRGWLAESDEALRAVQMPAGSAELVVVHKSCNRANELFFNDIASSETVSRLSALGLERGAEWKAWVRAVLTGIDECRSPLFDLNRAVQLAWEEFAERPSTGS